MTPEQFARLPKYAQSRISKLEKDVEWWRRKAEVEMAGGETDTFRRIINDKGRYQLLGLPKGSEIELHKAGNLIRVEAVEAGGYGRAGIVVSTEHDRRLLVVPHGPSVYVESRKRYA